MARVQVVLVLFQTNGASNDNFVAIDLGKTE
jgi:hypothetical protein